MMAGNDTAKGFASSLTEMRSWVSSCASSARRVGSDNAAKVRSRMASEYLTIRFSIAVKQSRVNRGSLPPGFQAIGAETHRNGGPFARLGVYRHLPAMQQCQFLHQWQAET